MSDIDNYLKGLLKQILDSYQILDYLKDRPGDLEIIKKELSKINGLITVLINKLESSKNYSDDFVVLMSSGKNYLENYYFLAAAYRRWRVRVRSFPSLIRRPDFSPARH